jgi:hypothetical protein
VRQFRRCERALAEELGVAPMPETLALLDAIQRGRLGPASVEEQPEGADQPASRTA